MGRYCMRESVCVHHPEMVDSFLKGYEKRTDIFFWQTITLSLKIHSHNKVPAFSTQKASTNIIGRGVNKPTKNGLNRAGIKLWESS